MGKKNIFLKLLFAFFMMYLIACQNNATDPSFSVLPDSEIYKQEIIKVPSKVDFLWVIDNSGSMKSSQDILAANFSAFISSFKEKEYDFQIAATTTEAYLGNISDDYLTDQHGNMILNQNTQDLENSFIDLVLQGTSGSGAEKAFQSFKTVLEVNKDKNEFDFPREDAFLAIIIVSDEDDYNSLTDISNPTDSYTANYYYDYLYSLKGEKYNKANFGVSAIAVFDKDCQDKLSNPYKTYIGEKYELLIDMTDGVKGSLCSGLSGFDNEGKPILDNNDGFKEVLQNIAENYVKFTTTFKIEREPIIESIQIFINDSQVMTDDPNGGWEYNKDEMSIIFYGDSVPDAQDNVRISYDPVQVIQ